jgi:hypothetical protein
LNFSAIIGDFGWISDNCAYHFYVQNNPVNMEDPSGKAPWWGCGLAAIVWLGSVYDAFTGFVYMYGALIGLAAPPVAGMVFLVGAVMFATGGAGIAASVNFIEDEC